MKYTIDLPTSIRVVSEDEKKGVFEIQGLYTGYGHTLGNSLRRVILSSLPGAAITTVKIEGISHEFANISGIKEDVLGILLNLKQIRFKMHTDEPQVLTILEKGSKNVTAKNIKVPTQVDVLNKEVPIATLVDKKTDFKVELTVEKGLGYVPREILRKEKVDIGTIVLDAIFTPIRKVHYEVENMRVGERTNYNLLRFTIETDGSITARQALTESLDILLKQFKFISGGLVEGEEKVEEKEEKLEDEVDVLVDKKGKAEKEVSDLAQEDPLKIRVEDLNLSNRTLRALSKVGIRTTGGLVRKSEEDLLKIEGLGDRSVQEIRRALGNLGLTLK